VLGGILLSDRAMYGLVIEEGLKAEDFYRERHRIIYESMLALYRETEPIDVLTVSEHLRSTGKIEEAGGKGLRLGTAEVSSKHANFIQADPGGSASSTIEPALGGAPL